MGQALSKSPALDGSRSIANKIIVGSYKKGGTVKKTGLALVHKGEKITPKSKALSKMKK